MEIHSWNTEQGWLKLSVKCKTCGLEKVLDVGLWDYNEWEQGKTIQNAMPYLSPGDRQLLLSSMCIPCIESKYPPPEDEEFCGLDS